ncbi:zinc finger CCHC domain-containing protein [Nakaseomyces bracarensis]|uniref:zinc finger CCHC domain-containing protein n=1 Tax=Nakaseomyces bracarensis TaxID=273131 RepID=UPI0038712777
MTSLSEVETMDTLPFVRDTTPMKDDDMKMTAPSIEQVGTDPNELRLLRGEGRYFGLEDADSIKEPQPKCRNCSQRGHFKRDCPHVICTFCGSMDDHYSQHCPKAIKCANCNETGHYRSQCPNKWKRVFCTLCNSKRHGRDRCPSIWRSYLLREDISKKELKLRFEDIYCYNCGGQGHYGDDCNQRRSSRVPNDDGSAFAGNNLGDEVRNKYYRHIDEERGKRKNKKNHSGNRTKKYPSNDHFDYNDYEYDDSIYDEWDNSQMKKNKKNKKKANNSSPLDFPRSNNRRNDSNYRGNDNQRKNNRSNGRSKNGSGNKRDSMYDDAPNGPSRNNKWNNSKKNSKSYRDQKRR